MPSIGRHSPTIACRKGTTRRVLVLDDIALKFAHGPRGQSCNLYEAQCYRTATPERRKILCPIVWCSPCGVLLIQRAAQPLTEAEKQRLLTDTERGFPDWGYVPGGPEEPFEYKAEDWGWYRGRLVALDYSAPALFVDQEPDD